MSPRLLDGWLRGIAYKPGWAFDTVEQDGRLLLRATVQVPDSRRAGRSTVVTAVVPLGDAAGRDESAFRRRVLALVDHLEDHEVREWLTFDGHRTFDPHT